jgi:hypothetical protein
VQEWQIARDTVVRDMARTVLYEEPGKDRHSGGDNGHTRKAALKQGTKA